MGFAVVLGGLAGVYKWLFAGMARSTGHQRTVGGGQTREAQHLHDTNEVLFTYNEHLNHQEADFDSRANTHHFDKVHRHTSG